MSYEAACGSFSSDIQPKMVAILRMYGCVCVCVWLCVGGGKWVCGVRYWSLMRSPSAASSECALSS